MYGCVAALIFQAGRVNAGVDGNANFSYAVMQARLVAAAQPSAAAAVPLCSPPGLDINLIVGAG